MTLGRNIYNIKIYEFVSFSFYARQHIYAIARICSRPSVRLPSVRLSDGGIMEKRLKLGSCNFQHTVAPSLQFLQGKFHLEVLRGSPEWERQTREGG